LKKSLACQFVSTSKKSNVQSLAAKLVAENIARQLERRINFRRATKMAAQNTMNAGAKGIRIEVAGRLNNAEMARREKIIEGSVPLHTLRADIDFHAGTLSFQTSVSSA
jgi:small subunit ribosomal protein S3